MKISFKFLCTFIVFLTLLVYSACRKTDQSILQPKQPHKHSAIEERFFNTNRTSDPTEKALVDYIKRRNDKEKFVEQTVKQIGFPRWDKTIKTASRNNVGGRGNSDTSLATYYVPFVRDSQNYVNAAMVIKTNPSDTTFSYKCDWQYAERQNELNSYTDSAEYYAIFFMVLDKTVFGHKEFEITDTTLFRHNNRKILKIRLDSLQVAGRSNFMVPIEVCEETTIWYQDCPWNNTTCAGPGGTCDNCWQCINYISWTYCWTEWIDSGGSGGTGGTGGSGGGSGGSGSGGSGTPPECQPTAVRGTNVNPNCEPGWNPVQNPVPIITYLTNTLGLSASQIAFLIQHPSNQISLYNYISQNYSSQSVQICKDHIDFLMAEPEYVQFVNNHNTTGNHSIVWWMDDTWLDNPQYFNLDPYDDYRKLTAAEKALVKQYPTAAFIINQFNRPMANNYTVQKFGINGLNDKSDAFRHAFFQAINTVRVGAVITKKFADAHETEVPLQLNKEKQMDTLNNNIGIAYGLTQTYPASTPIMIANAIYTKVLNGELWYIKPLDFSASPYNANRDGIQDCPTCLNGILSHSVLTPTNQ